MSKSGSVQMVERCHAITTRRGLNRRCMHVTRQGRFCNQHLKQHEGLRITKSQLPGAGKGLYTYKDIPKGAIIAQYTGDVVVSHDHEFANPYSLQIKERPPTYIDASKTNTGEARFANDARSKSNNAILVYNKRTKQSFLRAKRDIEAGEEVFTSYGDDFWDSKAPGFYLPNIKRMREASNLPPAHPRVDAVREPAVVENVIEPDEAAFVEEEEAAEAPAPKPRKKRVVKKKTIDDKNMAKTKKFAKTALRRLSVIQAIFNNDKIASQIKDLVKRKTKKEIRVPDSEGMTGTDFQLVLSKLITKEEKELAAYLKRSHNQIVAMVDKIVKR